MRLPSGLYKRGPSYYLDYKDETGKRIRRSAGPDLHRALDLLDKVRGPRARSDSGAGLKAVLDSYLSRQRVHSKRKSVKVAEYSVRYLLRHFGDPPARELNQTLVDAFVTARRADEVAAKTINNDLIVLRAALNHGVTVGLLLNMPLKIKLLKTPKRRITRILTSQEIKRILDCASGRIYGILLVAAHTGFRTDEILHLQWRDVGWDDCSLRVTTKEGIWSSKNHQERSVFISQALITWLRHRRSSVALSTDRDWVFSTRKGTPMTVYNVCRAVKKVFEKAGVYERGRPTIHLIRHTVACTLLANGTDLETVRDWLGHADIATTSVYLHSTDERKRHAAETLQLATIRLPINHSLAS
jgi:integrase